MKAIVRNTYGCSDVLHLHEVPIPTPNDDEVLVRIRAVSINSSDWEFLTGSPVYTRFWGFRTPRYQILGSDISGTVESAGKNVTLFQNGDHVFADILYKWGGFAEYVCVPEKDLISKPESLTFEEAAAIPQASTVALQGLRDAGQLLPGQKVLINGAGGGSGTFAIQLAKHFGAEVTGVDNGFKLELMRSIGADHVIDYREKDPTQSTSGYDLILDLVAHRSIFGYKRILRPNGKYILVGGSIGPILQAALAGPLLSIGSNRKMFMLTHKQNKEDLSHIVDLISSNSLSTVIDRTFPLEQLPEAFRYFSEGRALGKIVITI